MLEKPAEKVAWESAAFGKTIVFLREKAFAYNMATHYRKRQKILRNCLMEIKLN